MDMYKATSRMSPQIILIASLLCFIIGGNNIALRFSGYFVISELIVYFLKMFNSVVFPNFDMIYRPSGGGGCTGCGPFPICKECINVGGEIGMPSGHSSSMMMSATFWSLWIIYNTTSTKKIKICKVVLLFSLALLVVISRTELIENCHTIPQVTIGSILGIVLGIGFFYVDNKFVKN